MGLRTWPRRRFLGLAAVLGGVAGTVGCSRRDSGTGLPSPPLEPSPDESVAPSPPIARKATVARIWDKALLAAIRLDRPRPPVHARNLYHVSAAMWDAWAAYDTRAGQVFHKERATAPDIESARNEAISYAAYRLIRHRYERAIGAETTLANLDSTFRALGYDAENESTRDKSPAALGNRIFETILAAGLKDGSNQTANYAATNGYRPVNEPLIPALPGASMADPNRWQPLHFANYVEQNGVPGDGTVQAFVCPHWGSVAPFGVDPGSDSGLTPGPPPLLGGATDSQFKSEMLRLVELSSHLDPADNTTINQSPGAVGNNALGTNDGAGHTINPHTREKYAANVVRRADYARCIAAVWADGPDSETPPGHWNVIANEVSENALTRRRVGGRGPLADDLEWDVKLYLALNGAVHDAAIVSWGLKKQYDSVRPISAIRYTAGLGQSSDRTLLSYHANGIQLVPGLVEVITVESSIPGARHSELSDHIGEICIRAWRGPPGEAATEASGVGWILGKAWMPFQRTTFVTPAFAGYTSGHSTFSRAAAEVLALFTGSPFFPGGIAETSIPADTFLGLEPGPSAPLRFQWATYFDAADAAGQSRLYGGIHIQADDLAGRLTGSYVGKRAYERALSYFEGRAT